MLACKTCVHEVVQCSRPALDHLVKLSICSVRYYSHVVLSPFLLSWACPLLAMLASVLVSVLVSACQCITLCFALLQGSVETIARGHEASVRIAMQGHHAAAAAARLPVATLSQMLKSALSVELDTRQVSQRLIRLIKADRWHMKAEQILRSHAKPTGGFVSHFTECHGCKCIAA